MLDCIVTFNDCNGITNFASAICAKVAVNVRYDFAYFKLIIKYLLILFVVRIQI